MNSTCTVRQPGQGNEYKALNYCTEQIIGMSCKTDEGVNLDHRVIIVVLLCRSFTR